VLKVFYGGIAGRSITVPHSMLLRKLFLEAQKGGEMEIREDAAIHGDALVSRSRSIAGTLCLKSDCDVLLGIDSDIIFQPQDAIELCKKAADGFDIIGAVYMVRSLANVQPAQILGENKSIVFQPSTATQPNPPIAVRYLATGFMAVNRKVFEKLAETLPLCHKPENWGFYPFYMPFVVPDPAMENIYLSEDYAFCQRATEAGFKVWLDPTIRLGHIGEYTYRLEDFLAKRNAPQPIFMSQKEDGRMEIEGAQVESDQAGMYDKSGLIEDLSAFWKIDTDAVVERIGRSTATDDLARSWLEANPKTPEEMKDWYQNRAGPAYIEDLAYLNLIPMYWDGAQQLMVSNKRIIDFGGGIGSLSIVLKAVGNAVTFVEWPSKQRDFARWRFARRGLDINLADDLNNGMKDYDAIISTDVIEHIHPDEYDKVAQNFARVLKPDGEVKALARWTAIGEDCPMHFNEPDKWEAAMKRAGFRGGPVSWRKISQE